MILLFAIAFLGIPQNVNADEEDFIATVIDVNGVESSNIHDLYLYYYTEWGGYVRYYDSDTAESMLVRRGDSELTIPFSKIKEIEFKWAETVENSTVTVTTFSGEKMKGVPLRVSSWSFNGETDFGDFKLSVRKTKKVMFSDDVTPTSPTSTPVTTTPAPTSTPTVSSSPVPEVTPTSAPAVPGFDAIFAFSGLLAVLYILRRSKR